MTADFLLPVVGAAYVTLILLLVLGARGARRRHRHHSHAHAATHLRLFITPTE